MGLWNSLVSAFNSMVSFFASIFGGSSARRYENIDEEASPLVVTHGGDEEQTTTPQKQQSPKKTTAADVDDDSDTSEVSSGSDNPDEIDNDDIDLGGDSDDDDDDAKESQSKASEDKFAQYAAGRLRSGAFYDGSRPKINGGTIVKPELPFPSISTLVAKASSDEDVQNRTGNMQASKRFTVGFADTIGRRSGMEDAHSIYGCFGGVDTQDAFMIFDGHNGPDAANAANERMPAVLKEALATCASPEEALKVCICRILFPRKSVLFLMCFCVFVCVVIIPYDSRHDH